MPWNGSQLPWRQNHFLKDMKNRVSRKTSVVSYKIFSVNPYPVSGAIAGTKEV